MAFDLIPQVIAEGEAPIVPPFVLNMAQCGTSWACHAEVDGGWTIIIKKEATPFSGAADSDGL